jgi:hypothetical protein
MATQLTADDARQSLNAHVAAKGAEIFEKYGPHIGWKELQHILKDENCIRYSCIRHRKAINPATASRCLCIRSS